MSNFKFQISSFKFLTTAYFLGVVVLFFYSFTQVDLGLTLTRASVFQSIQTGFQYIGYFNRPVSTYLFVGIISYLYILYIYILFKSKNFSIKQIWSLVIFSSVLLSFSYTAFSYDIFNYIFDAKIWTHYGKNPYEFKALDFPGEPMLSFMHWTHRVYPYGPVWLFITIPVSYLGFGYFLPTYFLFKILMLSSYIGIVWLISKILNIISPKNTIFGVAFFGLNPFVLIESLVSAHVDIVMLFFFLLGLFLLMKKQYFFTFLLIVLGYGVKFASASFTALIHVASIVMVALSIGLFAYTQKRIKFAWETVFLLCTIVMILPVIFASMRTTFQPWYFLSIFPFAAVAGKKYYVVIPVIIMSFFVLLEYIPYLYLGNWDPPVPTILQNITLSGIGAAIVSTIGVSVYKQFIKK